MQIDYIVHESQMARMERIIKRLWILAIILIVLLFGSNAAWIWYENQFQDEVITVEAEQTTEGGGNNYALGGDFNGEATSQSNRQAEN